MKEHKFVGEHVMAELYGIKSYKICDNRLIYEAFILGIEKSGATCEKILTKDFVPEGFSVIALLSESHASLHTYPEKNAMFMDAFTCGVTCKPYLIIQEMINQLEANESNIRVVKRGNDEL